MFDPQALPLIFAALMGLSILLYVVLDGFDLGVGLLFPFAEVEERDRMVELTGRRTVPQIFIGDTHVGGCDDLVALDQRGGLMPLLGAA